MAKIGRDPLADLLVMVILKGEYILKPASVFKHSSINVYVYPTQKSDDVSINLPAYPSEQRQE